MKKLIITTSEKKENYTIYTGNAILQQVASLIDSFSYSKIVIITNSYLQKTWLEKLTKGFEIKPNIIIVEQGEDLKTIETVTTIWKKLLDFGCDRKSLVINFGGGIIGDMGGFAASTYMRGIPFVQIPTTLLSAVDASIGGKTGVNFSEIKNLIGSFQHPKAIIVDTAVMKTLPEREFLNGFAEMIKQGLIQDKAYFKLVTSKKPQLFSEEELVDIMMQSAELKATLVAQDETEQGKRKILNFGHTIGHAIESLSWRTSMPLRHGEAVHIGMIAETKLSNMIGLLSDEDTLEILTVLHNTGLPVTVKEINVKEIVNLIVKDKKNTAGQIKWVLLKHIGEAIYDQTIDDEQKIINALETILI